MPVTGNPCLRVAMCETTEGDQNMKKLLVVATILIALTISGCTFYFGPPRIITETVAVPSVESLSVQAVTGSIEIIGTARSDVAITAYVTRTSFGLFPETQTPVESVEIDIDTSNGIMIRHSPFDGRGISVAYEIEVPSDLAIDTVTSSTGSITVRNVAGDPVLNTSTGSITAEDVAGMVSADTSTGSLTIRGTDAVASLSSDTGSITAEIRGVPDNGATVPIETSTGSIRLSIDPTLSLAIHADTGTGSVTVDDDLQFLITHLGSDGLEATMNAGGNLLSVETGTGSITFSPLD
jgi:hypothetical protein